MAGFAAVAHAGVQSHVIAESADLLHRSGAVSDQGRAFYRRAYLAVFNAIGFGAGEHEFAVGDVDLTAAKANGIDPVLERGHEVHWVAVAALHIGVGHARHRRMGKAFAPTIACGLNPHQARVLPILHIADKDTVLDQHIAA